MNLLRLLSPDLARLIEDPLGEFKRLSEKADSVKLKIGEETCHLISSPETLKHVLLSNADNYSKDTQSYKVLKILLGNGLLTSSGKLWKIQRRAIAPAFKSESISAYLPILIKYANQYAVKWSDSAESAKTICATQDLNSITLLAVAEALLGEDLGDHVGTITSIFPELLEAMAERVVSPIKVPLFLPTVANQKLVRGVKNLRATVSTVIEHKRMRFDEGEVDIENSDLLTQLIYRRDPETGLNMSDEQIIDEAMTLLIAGHETTANALQWFFCLITNHPNIQKRVRHEINECCDCETPSINDYRNLTYLKSVIDETLRLYPPVWLFSRKALASDCKAGLTVRRGEVVLVCPYALHRHADNWDDPERFDPNRFLSADWGNVDPYIYMPFGAGRRSCLGAGFAVIESLVIIATLLKNLEITVVNVKDIAPMPLITLRTSEPLLIKATLIKNAE